MNIPRIIGGVAAIVLSIASGWFAVILFHPTVLPFLRSKAAGKRYAMAIALPGLQLRNWEIVAFDAGMLVLALLFAAISFYAFTSKEQDQ